MAVGVPLLLMAAQAAKIMVAASLGESADLAKLRRVLTYDGANPEVHRRLGWAYFGSFESFDPAEGLSHLRQATELAPHRAAYWLDLATACRSVGERNCADQAFERAVDLNPMTPRLRWAAASHYVATGRPDRAFSEFQRLLDSSPEYADAVFRLCTTVSQGPQVPLEKLIRPTASPKLKLAYINFLGMNGEPDLAYRVWVESLKNTNSFPFALAEPYLERLIELRRNREAVSVWEDLKRWQVVPTPADEEPDGLGFNGGFEQLPLSAGFDWRTRALPYVSVDFADRAAYHGLRCLRLDFPVPRNNDSEPVYQFLSVVPQRTYVLTAYARSENISSDSGPRLRVLDPSCLECPEASTEMTLGTTPWRLLRLQFSTSARTHLIRLSVWRPRSRGYPNEMSGRFWLDRVVVRELPEEKGR